MSTILLLFIYYAKAAKQNIKGTHTVHKKKALSKKESNTINTSPTYNKD